MKRLLCIGLLWAGLMGCGQRAEPTASRTEPDRKDSDVHIRTPDANVDIEHRDRGPGDKRVDVDVRRK
jgi:hypothetical protein